MSREEGINTKSSTGERPTHYKGVASSCVKSMSYDQEKKRLSIFYTNYSIYDYEGVPPAVYMGLLQADSKGRYLNTNVKGIYNYTKRSV